MPAPKVSSVVCGQTHLIIIEKFQQSGEEVRVKLFRLYLSSD